MFWHRVVPASAQRVATCQAVQRQVGPRSSTVQFKRAQREGRASGLEAARTAQPWAQQQPVAPHGGHQNLLRQGSQRCQKAAHSVDQAGDARRPAAVNICSSSARVASLSALDPALVNRLRSNGPRKRTTQRPASKLSPWRARAARICRLIKLRVTARRACLFGTTAPSHSPFKGWSSTAGLTHCNKPVDNCCESAFGCIFLPSLGTAARWCNAKCALLTRLRTRNTRSKSSERTMQPITAPSRPGKSSHQQRRALAAGNGTPPSAGPWARAAQPAGSDSQTLAALGAASVDHGTAAPAFHANEETVRACAADFGSLVGAFHDAFSFPIFYGA